MINEEHLIDPYRDAHPELKGTPGEENNHYNKQDLISF